MYQNDNCGPRDLGVKIIRELKEVDDWDAVREHVKNLRVLLEYDTSRELGKVRQEIRRHFPSEMLNENARDAYELLLPFQGTLIPYLDRDLSFVLQGTEFFWDSKFCEWAYVVNLNSEHLEVF